MQVILLGTAAGGGFPQWNCWCPSCRVARTTPMRAHPRSQSSAAVSVDGRHWFLLNASPDVREQIGRLTTQAPPGVRHDPIEGIVLTDAELDHSLGIALMREARHLLLYATVAVRGVLVDDSRIIPVTAAFAQVETIDLEPEVGVPLRYRDGSPSGLTVTVFAVPGDPPRFARRHVAGHTVGLLIRETANGATLAFVPGCGALDASLLARLRQASLLLFDGTFWADDEMIRLGLSERTARQMDHLPQSGPDGSLQQLRQLGGTRVVYTHINNSNPMLIEDSPERREVRAAGLEIGDDGMAFTLT